MPTNIVHRTNLPVEDGIFGLELPKTAKIIHFGYQGSRRQFSLWYAVDLNNKETVFRRFAFTATGMEVPLGEVEDLEPVGSALMPDGFTIFHLLEIVRKETSS